MKLLVDDRADWIPMRDRKGCLLTDEDAETLFDFYTSIPGRILESDFIERCWQHLESRRAA